MADSLLEVQDLRVHFHTEDGVAAAVDGVSFRVGRGETVGLVGESGCGKSVTALSVMRLLPSSAARIAGGRVLLEGEDLLRKPEAAMRRVRGRRVAMIFQEPTTALNPVLTVGEQVAEAVRVHRGLRPRPALEQVVELLRDVGIADPERAVRAYPHQMSAGMRQRVMIAMAMACRPELLIADEPTAALDVTVQAQVLDRIQRLGRASGMAVLLITHDLGVVARMADRVVVMHAGRVVEVAGVDALFRRPLHPYSEGLLHAVPRLDGATRSGLRPVRGRVPDPARLPPGCRFAGRCPYAVDRCRHQDPPLEEAGDGRLVACWRHGEIETRGVA